MLRIFANIVSRSFLTKTRIIQPSIPFTKPFNIYQFAKLSKKQEQKQQKKKQKQQTRQELGGEVKQIDLNKYDQKYKEVIQAFKNQIQVIKVGRLEPNSLSNLQIKINNQITTVAACAQVSSKSANICIVSPYDTAHIDQFQKGLKMSDDSLQIKRSDNMLILTQVAQGKQIKDKLLQKLKKLTSDRKQDLKKIRSNTQQQLKKYKKIVPQQRLRVIQNQAKSIFQKKTQQLQKIQKDKQKQLNK